MNSKTDIEESIEEIYKDHMNLFLSVAYYSFGLNRESGEDRLNDTFIKMWNYRQKIKNQKGTSIRSFALRVFRNTCIDHLRKTKRNKETPIDDLNKGNINTDFTVCTLSGQISDPLNQMLLIEELRLQKDALDRLPQKYRDVVRLRLQGLKSREIAKKLGIKDSILKNLIHRGLKKFRLELEKIDPDRMPNG